ncbi:MAG: transcriptional regulator [Spongiibacteraceae bacterium]
MTLLEYVAQARGMQAELALELGIDPVLVHQWAHGKRRVPAERVLGIEAATMGDVSRHILRPDLYPAENSAA